MPKQLRRTGVLILLILAIGFLFIGALLLYLNSLPLITIDVSGETLQIRGRFDTVADALEAAGVTLREEDLVWPSVEDQLPMPGYIAIRAATPVSLTIDGETRTVWTHQTNLASFLAEQAIDLKRTTRVQVGDQIASLSSLADTSLGQTVRVTSNTDVHIGDRSIQTSLNSVGELLVSQGVGVYVADSVQPELGSWLEPEQRISIERATPITVTHDDRQLIARTSRSDVAGVLADLGIGLIGRQQATPQLDQPITGIDAITIRQATTVYELTESPIPYSSRVLPQEDMEIDQRSLVISGSAGVRSQLFRIELDDSEPLSRTLVADWVSEPPTDEVVGYGTTIVVRSLETPQGTLSYWRQVRMRVSAYTAADAGKPPSHPSYGITASGRPAGYGVVAVDPNVVPFRSQVYVPGYGIGFAGDTGGGVRGRFIDLGYDVGEIQSWSGYVDVYYLTPVPDLDEINFLLP